MWASRWWALPLLLAVAEVVALGVRRKRVASQDDWTAASAFVRENFTRGDAITSAPAWTDPTLRLHLGDKINTKIAGRADLAPFERLWVLSIRGARAEDAPAREPDARMAFGRVIVDRYDFGPTPEVLDLVDALPQARVSVTRGGKQKPCRFNARAPEQSRGGLGRGPVYARQRFECSRTQAWNHVGVTVIEDLDLKPRRCIWQHPVGKEPVSVQYEDIHLGTQLAFHGGLYYEDERGSTGGDVGIRILVDGREVASWTHQDGDGFRAWRADTLAGRPPGASPRGVLRIEVTANEPYHRSFCWAGSIRDAQRREAP